MIDRPGIYPDMSAEEYFADPAPKPSLTQSLAKLLIARSPLHAKYAHPRLADPAAEDEPAERYDKAKAIGTAAHSLMLGRGKDLYIAPFDSWRTGEAKKERAINEAKGKAAILRPHFDIATRVVDAGVTQLEAAGLEDTFTLDGGNSEVCVAWEEDGIWFRTLIDWLPHDHLTCWDYKTTEMSVAPHAVGRMMSEMGWDVQAAMHDRGLRALYDHGVRRPDGKMVQARFRFVAQEQEPPYALVVCEMSDDVMEVGRRKLLYAITQWRECMLAGQFPGYPPEIIRPTYPAWAESAWLQREISEAARERHGDRDAANLMAG